MSFNEKHNLRDERSPLIQNPTVWTRSQEYNLESDCSYGRNKRKEQFQWIVFIGVTIFSVFILLAVIGVAIKSNEMLPPLNPRPLVPTTAMPISSTASTTLQTPEPSVASVSTSTTTIPPVVEEGGGISNTNTTV